MIKFTTIRKYGVVDILFALLYLSIFLFILPAYDVTARVLTLFFPIVLLLGGAWLVYEGKYAREVGIGMATLFVAITIFSLFLLAYTAGYFKGIYGPLGQGITIISYLGMVFVVQLFGIWPLFQLKALWPEKSLKNAKRATKPKVSTPKQAPNESEIAT
ncbi:hypothetical protein KJ865_01990 [Myxococcota bacterium]|nr:hypothetical protein [Myxococcota bacterium]